MAPDANRQARRYGEDTDAGFSLMEILLSLAIFALIISISGAIGIRAISAQKERTERRQIIQSLEFLRYSALIEEANIRIANFSDWPQELSRPQNDWALTIEPPLTVNAAGQCSASFVTLTSPRQNRYRYQIDPKSCSLAPV